MKVTNSKELILALIILTLNSIVVIYLAVLLITNFNNVLAAIVALLLMVVSLIYPFYRAYTTKGEK